MKITPAITKKPLDIIKFKVKSKDCDTFLNTTFAKMNDVLVKKEKYAVLVLENPAYKDFESNFKETHFAHWASLNLNRKGFETSIPSTLDPNATCNFYLLTSERSYEKLAKKFYGIKSLTKLLVDNVKALSTSMSFSRMVGGAGRDIHYSDAYTFLYDHEVNKHQTNRFQKFLNKMNVKEVDYKPQKK
ncbi:MAG: hypothetical protein WCF95_05045 [bacterium]